MVNQVFYVNSDKYPAIANECQQVKDHVDKSGRFGGQDSFACVFEALPPVRRTLSIPDKIKNGDTTTALGMASLALINLPEDLRDIRGAYNQLNGAKAAYDYKNYQHSFSFFKGTAIEEWLCKHFDMGKKWAVWLRKNDITLAGTSFGKKIKNLVKAKESDIIETSITNFMGEQALAYKYSGSGFAKLTCRAMRRTTLLGIGAIALLELPKIIKSDEKIKQTAKSAVNIASVTAGIGYCGAIGAKYGGATGSLIGMGLGAILGSKISNKVQEII